MRTLELKLYNLIIDRPGIRILDLYGDVRDMRALMATLEVMERRGDIVIDRDHLDTSVYEVYPTVD